MQREFKFGCFAKHVYMEFEMRLFFERAIFATEMCSIDCTNFVGF